MRYERLSDLELVELCNTADAASAKRAFEVLYTRHKTFVLRVALAVVHDHALALDALQETFTTLLVQFPPPGEGLKLTARLTSYLYPIARNAAISQLRKAQRTRPDDATEPDELAFLAPDSSDDIDILITELSRERREVITLRYVLDLPIADIADALDLPVGTVKSRLNAAVTQLRNSPKAKHFFEK